MSRAHFTLDRRHIPALAAFLEGRGFTRVPLKGEYEVARFVSKREIPIILFRKAYANSYATVQDKDVPVVKEFLRALSRARAVKRRALAEMPKRPTATLNDSPYRDEPTTAAAH